MAKLKLVGLGVSLGLTSGKVLVVRNQSDLKRIKAQDIVVARRITLDWWAFLRKSQAIISETGAMTSHAACLAREIGIPCVVGVKNATLILHNGDLIKVNGSSGEIDVMHKRD
jgi:pyruvate,water dikinase